MTLSTLTVGSNSYQSYASVAEADAYLLVDLVRGPSWSPLTNDEKSKRLVAATRRLDLLTWKGKQTGGGAQGLEWPRSGLTYEGGAAVPDNIIPDKLAEATALLAGTITMDSTHAEHGGGTTPEVKRVQAGTSQVEFFSGARLGDTESELADTTALQLIRQWTEGGAAVSIGGLAATGLSGTSSFTSTSDLERGFA